LNVQRCQWRHLRSLTCKWMGDCTLHHSIVRVGRLAGTHHLSQQGDQYEHDEGGEI
jgi:hypothetical protein